MPDVETTTYRLYALPLNDETVEEAQKHRFSRITPLYLLIYTEQQNNSELSVEITEEEVERLTSADRDWLLGCNMLLIADDAKKREKEISVSLGEKIEKLEQALEEAMKKQGVSQNAE